MTNIFKEREVFVEFNIYDSSGEFLGFCGSCLKHVSLSSQSRTFLQRYNKNQAIAIFLNYTCIFSNSLYIFDETWAFPVI